MKYLLIIFTLLMVNVSKSQTLTIDPTLTLAVTTTGAAEKSSLDDIKSTQNKINTAVAATTAIVTQINEVQKKIYTGLTTVYDNVNSLYKVALAADLVKDILSNESMMISTASKNPLALAFVTKQQAEIVKRAIALGTEVSSIVLVSNGKMQLDAGDRLRVLDGILNDLRLINGLVMSSYFKVKWVVMQGVINALNPFGSMVNRDASIINDIMGRWAF